MPILQTKIAVINLNSGYDCGREIVWCSDVLLSEVICLVLHKSNFMVLPDCFIGMLQYVLYKIWNDGFEFVIRWSSFQVYILYEILYD